MVVSLIGKAKRLSNVNKSLKRKQNGATDKAREIRADRNLTKFANQMLTGRAFPKKPPPPKRLASMKAALKSALEKTAKDMKAAGTYPGQKKKAKPPVKKKSRK